MNKIKWTKPSGVEIETNDLPATIAICESLDWERAKPKRGRPKTKVESND